MKYALSAVMTSTVEATLSLVRADFQYWARAGRLSGSAILEWRVGVYNTHDATHT